MSQHTPAMSEHEYRENKFFSIFGSVPEPAFDSETEQVEGWGRRWGCTSDIGKLRAVLMHRPGAELSVVENKPMPEIGGFGDPQKGWYWMGRTMPDLPAMQAAHDQLAGIVSAKAGVEVVLRAAHRADPRDHAGRGRESDANGEGQRDAPRESWRPR